MKFLNLCCQLSLIVVFSTQSFSLLAQIPSYDKWYKGEVILKDASTYQGELKYDFRDDILYFKKDTLNLIFHASYIKDFTIFRSSGTCDKFTALAYRDKRKKRFKIFQVVYPGKKSEVLARENYLVNSNYTNIPVSGSGSHKASEDIDYYRNRTKIKTEFIYFILAEGGSITEIKLTRRKILKAFPDKKELLKDYIANNNLYFRKFGDIVKVVEYYDVISRR